MNYCRLANENENEYVWRLCFAKDSGEIDLSWDDLAEIINREIYGTKRIDEYKTSSAYRKPFQSAKMYYENVFSKFTDESVHQDIQEKIFELNKLKKQVQTEKVEYNKWLRDNARDELIVEKIIDAIKTTSTTPLFTYANKETKNKVLSDKDKSHILLFGDAHFGSEFQIKGLHGEIINSYSPEVFYSRMEQILHETIGFIQINNINHLYIYDLGDDIDGILRVSQLSKLRYGVVDSAVMYAKFIAKWLNELSKYASIDFRMVNGNHSELRMLSQPKGTFANDNMGYIINEIICIMLEGNDNITIKKCPQGIIHDKIQGYDVVAYHGENKNLEKALNSFASIYNINIDLLIAAHFHHSISENIGIKTDIMRIPSIIGMDDYSLKLLKSADAGATIITIAKNKGKINDYHIKLN